MFVCRHVVNLPQHMQRPFRQEMYRIELKIHGLRLDLEKLRGKFCDQALVAAAQQCLHMYALCDSKVSLLILVSHAKSINSAWIFLARDKSMLGMARLRGKLLSHAQCF